MHYTACPSAPAENIGLYFNSLRLQNPSDNVQDIYASAHASVDKCTTVQNLPWDEMGYHCGSPIYTQEGLSLFGTYPNNSTVGIEMCVEADGSIHEDTFNNAADLVVYLIKYEGFPNILSTHKRVVGWKNCPLPWVVNPVEFDRFVATVNEKLSRNEVDKVSDQIKKQALDLVQWQWQMLYEACNGLYHEGILTDWTWAEKAANKQLTPDEIMFLNMVINAKQSNVKFSN